MLRNKIRILQEYCIPYSCKRADYLLVYENKILILEFSFNKLGYELQYETKLQQAIGYKEIIDYLNGKYDLVSAIELIKKRTRKYAKRQVNFFKHQFDSSLYVDVEQFINSL